MESDNSELFPLSVWSLLFHVIYIYVWAANLTAVWTKLFILSHQHKTFISVTNNFFFILSVKFEVLLALNIVSVLLLCHAVKFVRYTAVFLRDLLRAVPWNPQR